MAKVGDYVALPGGGYGVVTAIDGGTGDAEINPMTEADIKKEIESSTGKKVQSIK
jgi:preprotein translocase subunit YajC